MALSPMSSLVRGIDYQAAVGWLWACRMLQESETISSVCAEDSAGGAFDDVVVRRDAREDIYIQAKTSNYGAKVVDGAWLLAPPAKGGRSPLQRFYDTYISLSAKGGQFSLELWTSRGFDHQNPLLGDLLDKKRDKISTLQMLESGSRSKVGMERDLWAGHLRIGAERLAEFLGAVRWKHTGSELDISEQAKPLMRLAGLRNDDAAVRVGVGIVRGWVSDGAGAQTVDDVGRTAAELGLTPAAAEASAHCSGDDALSGLPPECRDGVSALRESSPEQADMVVSLLSQTSSRVPGVLAHLAEHPPQWLAGAGCLAWETLGDFIDAHRLSGSWAMRRHAIKRGSTRSVLYRVVEAGAAVGHGDAERAEELLSEVPTGDPLLEVARACISGDVEAVIAAVRASAIHQSPDLKWALYGVMLLVDAHRVLGEPETGVAVLREASLRFPDQASLRLNLAKTLYFLAHRHAEQGTQRPDLLESAVDEAIIARDRFREWRGPSAEAVSVAASALLMLGDPMRARGLAAAAPEGEAEQREAEDGRVVECLAHALLDLGRVDDLARLNLDLVDGAEGTLLRAMRARSRGDAGAVELMRTAVEQADDDRTLLMALEGLALSGETDETALAGLPDESRADADLIRAKAAFCRGDHEAASCLLMPYRFESADHAELLAAVQHQTGSLEDARETLLESAEALSDPFLYSSAVGLLMELEDFQEAERVALDVLAENPPRSGGVAPETSTGASSGAPP